MRPTYGIRELVNAAKDDPKRIRRKLRALGVKKNGKYYDFKSEKGIQDVVQKLNTPSQ